MSDPCIFCKIANNEMKSDVVYQDDLMTAIRDIRPVASTHILIMPNRHIDSLNQFTAGDEALIGRMFSVARQLAAQEKIADSGYRLVVNTGPHGGQTVSHFHVHLIGGQQMGWPPG
jgi:histidine triad (HIT) family protein